jgi:MFS superfamily sulfate permease-like transporter
MMLFLLRLQSLTDSGLQEHLLLGSRRAGMSIMLIVFLLTVLVDLMTTAVGVGIIMASLVSASRLSKYQLAHISLI